MKKVFCNKFLLVTQQQLCDRGSKLDRIVFKNCQIRNETYLIS